MRADGGVDGSRRRRQNHGNREKTAAGASWPVQLRLGGTTGRLSERSRRLSLTVFFTRFSGLPAALDKIGCRPEPANAVGDDEDNA
jgi:hypothetical protein